MSLLFERVEKSKDLWSVEIRKCQRGRRSSKLLLAEPQEEPKRVAVAQYGFRAGVSLFNQVLAKISLNERRKVGSTRDGLAGHFIAPFRRRKQSARSVRLPCS